MTDDIARDLERTFRESGLESDERAWLQALARACSLDWSSLLRLRQLDSAAAQSYLVTHKSATMAKKLLALQEDDLLKLVGTLSNHEVFLLGYHLVNQIPFAASRGLISGEVVSYALGNGGEIPSRFGGLEQHVFPVDDTLRGLLHAERFLLRSRERVAVRRLRALEATVLTFGGLGLKDARQSLASYLFMASS